MNIDLSHAREMDKNDPLASYRDQFVITDPDLIYLDGNSMGRMPKATQSLLEELQTDWSDRLIRTWGEKHFHINQKIGAKMAKLIGAQPDEVIIAESTSINFFKLVVAALQAQTGRTQILTDDMNFPSDLYVMEGINEMLGGRHTIEAVPSADQVYGPADEIVGRMGDNTALVTLCYTSFKSAYNYDMAAINKAAQDAGALTIWDLSHSVGSVPLDLNGTNADMAIGCTYKYLNGGPGAPAFLYIRKDLQQKLRNPITGWMSQANQFDFGLEYSPLPGIKQFLTGTPTVLSMAPIGVGVDMLLEAGMDNVRQKSVALSEYMIELFDELLLPLGYSLKSPRNSEIRGSHISIGHPEAWRICQTLINDKNVIPDFRAPDNIRLGITPLYTSFEEIHLVINHLKEIVEEKQFEKYSTELSTVT
ncbi:MAG: kynureninase [Cellvibrionaceae bacterium]|jgi:kynureninase